MRGHDDIVMSPTAYCYLDYYQSTNQAAEPPAATWGGPLTLKKVYSFDPMPAKMPSPLESHIPGAQGNLWTEWVPNLTHAEHMMSPRLSALAEVVWSPQSTRHFKGFSSRLQVELQRFDELGINYRPVTKAAVMDPNK